MKAATKRGKGEQAREKSGKTGRRERLLRRHWKAVVTLLFGILVFLFWCCCFPQSLCYHEEKQLFLWSVDYFLHDVSIAGGLADWVSEFIVQFFYVTWMGALLLALLFVAMQWTTYKVALDIIYLGGRREGRGVAAAYAVSYVMPLFFIGLMGDINMLWSFPVAIVASLAATAAMDAAARKTSRAMWIDILVLPVLFWLIGGGATWLYLLLRLVYAARGGYGTRLNHAIAYLIAIPYLFGVQTLAGRTVLRQWPQKSVYIGLNYYIVPMQYPGENYGYDRVVYEMLMQDYLVRQQRWNDIIRRAEDYHTNTVFSCNCVNLALSQKRLLAERMFDFYQSGEDALLLYRVRDNMSTYPTMEAFWCLGLVNSCLRYASDLQESILNFRKSGRLTRRIAECHIVNGNYGPARKNIDLLKQSLFYRRWALKAEKMLGNENAINADPVLGKVRRYRFKEDMVFSYPEKEKILGQLFINNPRNTMALDYFLGDLLLKGQHANFLNYIKWARQYGGYVTMPKGYQDALRSIQAHGAIPGSPYSEYGKQMMRKRQRAEEEPEP